jgi:hypothetical protein
MRRNPVRTFIRISGMAAAAAAFAVALSLTAYAGQAKSQAVPPKPQKVWKAEEALRFTCAQAWVAAGESYEGVLKIVETLAQVSLENRVLAFPDTREAGLDAGNGIARDCAADPNGLLFAIVDTHVRRVAEAAAKR